MWVTLTYSPEEVPITDQGYMSLDRRHIQLFFKNFRKAHRKGAPPIKYFGCGEYGSQFWRPHYHIAILNGDERHLYNAWVDREAGSVRGDIFIDPRPLSEHAIKYTAFYMSKPRRVPEHRMDDRRKEFTFMSKHIGDNYVTPDTIKYHNADINRNFLTIPGGHKIAMPRYYRDKIFDRETRLVQNELIAVVAKDAADKEYNDYVTKHGNALNFYKDRERARGAHMREYFKSKNKRT